MLALLAGEFIVADVLITVGMRLRAHKPTDQGSAGYVGPLGLLRRKRQGKASYGDKKCIAELPARVKRHPGGL